MKALKPILCLGMLLLCAGAQAREVTVNMQGLVGDDETSPLQIFDVTFKWNTSSHKLLTDIFATCDGLALAPDDTATVELSGGLLLASGNCDGTQSWSGYVAPTTGHSWEGAITFAQEPHAPQSVPEPSSILLLLSGFVCLMFFKSGRRFRQHNVRS